MDEKQVPENVEVHKRKKPKGWTYPLQTMEIVEGLALEGVDRKITVDYDNSPERFYRSNEKRSKDEKSFPVFSLKYYGHMKQDPFFNMTVRVCKPQYRQRLRTILLNEVFPVVREWMKKVERVPYITTISLRYRHWNLGESIKHRELVLCENNENDLFVKQIDFEAAE